MGPMPSSPSCRSAGSSSPYEFVRNTRNLRTEAGAPGTLTSSTTGVRMVGKFSPLTDYNIEMAVQRGSLAADDISAWAGHWLVGRTMTRASKTYRAFGEYNYASGDETPGDGKRGTFDQLYPTPHDKYGLADQVGWKNIHHLRTGIEMRPQPRLTIGSSYHSFWLATARDALYTAGGAVLARIPADCPPKRAGSACRAGARHPGHLHAVSSDAAARRLLAHFSRRVPEGGDAGQIVQRPLRDGDHDASRTGEIGYDDNQDLHVARS